MANATPSNFGQVNNAGAADALFLKVASGEILAAFNQMQVAKSRHMTRTIKNGKSATFPVIGRTSASLHTKGSEILGNQILANERVITIDGLLVASAFISEIDEAKNHYDVRGEYTRQIGEALANTYDMNVFRTMLLGARSVTPLFTGDDVGKRRLSTNPADVTDLVAALSESAQALSEKRVPTSERSAFVRPAQFSLLTTSTLALDNQLGGVGSFARRQIGPVAGLEIVETINIPSIDESADASVIAAYRADYSATVGIVAHRSGAGTVQLMDVATEIGWDMRLQGTLMIGKQAVGHDFLRPASLVELTTAAS